MKKLILSAAFLAASFTSFAQVGVGTITPDASAALDVTSTTSGLLIPRLTTVQRTAIASPAEGLEVYDTDTKTSWYYNGTEWVEDSVVDNVTFTQKVYFNGTDANTQTSGFDDAKYWNINATEDGCEVNASFTADPLFDADQNLLYIGQSNCDLDGDNSEFSYWTYDGSQYIAYARPSTTPFHISGTTLDAGSDKTSEITRNGGILIQDYEGSRGLIISDKGTWSNGNLETIEGIRVTLQPNFTSADASPSKRAMGMHTAIVSSDDGSAPINYLRGMSTSIVREDAAASMGTIIGNYLYIGHNSNVTGNTNSIQGYASVPRVASGTVTNLSDFIGYSMPLSQRANVTNHYGVYIQGDYKSNIFEGSVGIGTSTPSAKLQVNGKSLFAGSSSFARNGNPVFADIVTADQETLNIFTDDSTSWLVAEQDENAGVSGNMAFVIDNDGTATPKFDFYSKSDFVTPLLTIRSSSRNVGINTNAPKSKLHVVGLVGYATDAAAGTAGLTAGAFYQTLGHATLPDGIVMVKQ